MAPRSGALVPLAALLSAGPLACSRPSTPASTEPTIDDGPRDQPVAELPAPNRPPSAHPPAIVLVSWDTTRADALSCYADQLPWRSGDEPPRPPGADDGTGPAPSTPNADALAARGVRFAWALTQAPTTLSAHASLMSGLDLHGHRVVRNGYPVPTDVPLLAERFAEWGWDTVAVVGSSPLEAAMGLDRGFRTYDDAVGTAVRLRVEDRADRVTRRALLAVDEHLSRRGDAPLLLFVHYFDAHSPWTSAPPEAQRAFLTPGGPSDLDGSGASIGRLAARSRAGLLSAAERQRARALYLAEVAWMDVWLGRLLAGLEARGFGDDLLIALVADHGEVLDEVPERPYGHGPDVDLGASHIPVLLAGTGGLSVPGGRVVERQVRLLDVGATLLAIAGLPHDLGSGEDLSELWDAEQAGPAPAGPPAFIEATKPREQEDPVGWNNLPFERGVAQDGRLLTRAAVLGEGDRLFQLAPGQPELLVGSQGVESERRRQLSALLDAWDAAAPAHREAAPDGVHREALRALGYLEGDGAAQP